MVEFDKDCGWENVMQPNFTAMPDLQRPTGGQNASQIGSEPKRDWRRLVGKQRFDTAPLTLETSLQA